MLLIIKTCKQADNIFNCYFSTMLEDCLYHQFFTKGELADYDQIIG
jgi:hypothetical protein